MADDQKKFGRMLESLVQGWAAHEAARLGQLVAQGKPITPPFQAPKAPREVERKPVRYRMWQVGWEDEAFETGCDEDVSCPTCEHEHAGAPPSEIPNAAGMVVFMAFHKADEPDKIECRRMEVINSPLAFLGMPKYAWACSTVSLEEAKRRQPIENPRHDH